MQAHDELIVTGKLRIQHYDGNGNLKEDRTVPNLVVTTGKQHIAARLAASPTPPTAIGWMAVGTNNAGLAVGNTQLGAEVTVGKVALTSGTSSTNIVTYIATFPAGTGTGALVEAGLFNAAGLNTGVMLCRTIFNVVTKEALDAITITWTLTIS